MPSIATSTRHAATAMIAAEVVADVARVLGSVGMDVMPVKGAVLQLVLYSDPAERPLTDVDVVVRPAELDAAVRTLCTAGYEQLGGNGMFAVTLRSPLALTLDLHGGLFDKARYRYDVETLFARARRDRALFGAPVLLPSDADMYAQLVGKFSSDHLDDRATDRLRDLVRAGRALDLDPHATAQLLHSCGMGRAARYTLGVLHSTFADRTAAAVLDALPPDRTGDRVVRLARLVIGNSEPGSASGAVMAHLLNATVPRGLWSGARAIRRRRLRRS